MFEFFGPVQLENLRTYHRPVRGGSQVRIVPQDLAECSAGFIAVREAQWFEDLDYTNRYLITASHCAPPMFENYGTIIGQPTEATRIGVEFSDPPPVGNAVDSACPTSGNICRRSDAVMFLLDNNSDTLSTFNGFALTTGTYTLAGTDYYDGRMTSFGTDMAVSKVGRTTGTTSGVVTNSCANVFISPYYHVCQYLANYSSQGGDSGAPVWHTTSSGEQKVMGTHTGTDPNTGEKMIALWVFAWSEFYNDILAQTGTGWGPAITN